MCANKIKKILLVGNPNTGKSTLFNLLTKSYAHTGNFHGVTVNAQETTFKIDDKTYTLVDLPGIYSLSPNSYEEQFSIDYILNNKNCPVICVCTNQTLKKNMLLLYELLQLNRKVILVINKIDNKTNLDVQKLEKILNIKIFLIDAKNKKTAGQLLQTIKSDKFLNNKLKLKNNAKLNAFKQKVNKLNLSEDEYDFYCQKSYCDDKYYCDKLKLNENILNNIDKNYLEEQMKEKYNFIDNALKQSNYFSNVVVGKSKLDKFILNKYLCIPIFLLIMTFVFYFTFFSVGAYLSNFLRWLIQDVIGNNVSNFLSENIKATWLVNLVKEGVFGGVGTIVSFLPQIVLLFVFLALLEDSGYLSRLAFLVDDALKKVGLSGKSVYTLLMSFGCSTTACLTARNMNDKNAKIKTALLTPYMSCSAKLPVYAVIGGAFFGASNVGIIMLLYVLGIILAIILSLFFEKTYLKSNSQTFILEFPSYRKIDFLHLYKITKINIKSFMLKIGSLLFGFSILVWFFENFTFTLKYVQGDDMKSMLQCVGEFIAPIFKPLGFASWGTASALLTGIVAKEIIISSIAIFNNINSSSVNFMENISQSLTNPLNVVFFTPSSALSFMVFCLLYCPCVGTISVLRKEIGKKWTIIAILLQFVIAYCASLFVYFVFKLTEIYGILTVLLFAIIIFFCVSSIINFIKLKKSDVKCLNCSNDNCKYKR